MCIKEGLTATCVLLAHLSILLPVCFSVTAINGYMFGNLPGIQLCQHRAVAWHLFGMGNEVDIHSAFFHGNTLLDRGHRTDVLSLFPATFATAEMVPKAMGKWLLTCQVNDHLQGTAPDLWPLDLSALALYCLCIEYMWSTPLLFCQSKMLSGHLFPVLACRTSLNELSKV